MLAASLAEGGDFELFIGLTRRKQLNGTIQSRITNAVQ